MNDKNKQNGFSLVELLLVVTIIGIIASIGVPSYKKAKLAAENAASTSSLRTFSTHQIEYFRHNNRFARLSELNAAQSNTLGTTISPSSMARGSVTYTIYNLALSPSPSDADLESGYIILAVRPASGDDSLYTAQLDQSGNITQITP